MLTDVWMSGEKAKMFSRSLPQLAQRRHDDLPDRLVESASAARISLDLKLKLQRVRGWDAIIERNAWFQKWAATKLERADNMVGIDIVFAYSYAARLPFKVAKARGAKLVLGQIDPGPLEQVVVDQQTEQYRHLATGESSPPERYWDGWREEIELADYILVNSSWSAELLVRDGVSAAKLIECPLAYDSTKAVEGVERPPRAVFSAARPLKVLFLGQVILRKGIGQFFDAIRLLRKSPVHFTIAGPVGVTIPTDISGLPNVLILGAVDRAACRKLYEEADVFILPTLSDGFAITQLEALAHGVPVMASRFCGDVVKHGKNGWLLDMVTPGKIASAILGLLENRMVLESASRGAFIDDRFSMVTLSDTLSAIGSGGASLGGTLPIISSL